MSTLANPPSPRPGVQPGRPWIAIGLLLPVLLATPATAAPITYAFRGTVHHADVDSGVQVGDPFSGTITFDPAEPVDRQVWHPPGDQHNSIFHYGKAVEGGTTRDAGMTLSTAGRPTYTFSDGLTVGVGSYTFVNRDNLFAHTSVSITPDGFLDPSSGLVHTLTLVNSMFTPAGAAEMTTANLDLAKFPFAQLDVSERNIIAVPIGTGSDWPPSPRRGFGGGIESFEIVPTPEPSTFALLGLGVAGWVIRRRRRADGPVPPERLEAVA